MCAEQLRLLYMMQVLGALSVTSMPEQKRQFIMNIPAEAENTLEEFAWAFGEDTVNEIERRVHIVLEHIHQMRISSSWLSRESRS